MKKIVLIFFICIAIYANGKPTLVDNQIINLALNYQFDEAEKLLQKLFDKSDELKNHYLYLNIELIKSIHAAEIVPWKAKRSVKDSINKILIDYSEKVIEKFEDTELSIYDKFYLGSIHGLLGRFYGVNRSWYSAFSNGKDGKNILEEVVEEDNNFIDAYLLLGMMNYYADRLGGVTEFIAGILGLSGDRRIGLQYLHKVDKYGNLTKWQATMILAELYSRMENNKFDALPLLKKFSYNFPENTHFANWYCYELVDLFLTKEVGEIINSDENYKITDFVKGKYYHLIGNYKKSNEIYDTLLAEKGILYPWVYEDSKFNQTINYFMLGKTTEADKSLKTLNKSYLEKAQQLLGYPRLAKELIKFKENILLNKSQALSFINTDHNFEGSKFLESYYNFYCGIYYYKKGNCQAAAKNFQYAKSLDLNNFGFDCYKYLIQIYKVTYANRKDVGNLIDEIEDFDNEGLEFSAQDLKYKYKL